MVLLLGSFLLTSCSKNEINPNHPLGVVPSNCVPYDGVEFVNDWNFQIGDTFKLRHTPGLRNMALSGSHGILNSELCGIGVPRQIPPGLEDDPEGDGYAGQLQYHDYIIAMYHPTTYPDHFITYNTIDGSWIRWDLSEGPGIFRQSN